MRKVLPFVARYRKAIKPTHIDDYKKPEFFDGYSEFRYDYESNTKNYNRIGDNIRTTEQNKVLITYSNIDFKLGDRVEIDGLNYNIRKIDVKVDDKFKNIVAKFPKSADKYSYKRLEL